MMKVQVLCEFIDEVELQIFIMCGDDLGDVFVFEVVVEWINVGYFGVCVVSFFGEQLLMVDYVDVICDQIEGILVFLRDFVDCVCVEI